MSTLRQTTLPIHDQFTNRWSPRSFDQSPMNEQDLLTMLEAARWAPSAFNVQPWRFVYALRQDENWESFLEILNPFNASWAKDASALIIVLSDTIMVSPMDGLSKPSGYNSFDTGAAWAQFALQASHMGYSSHAVAGNDIEKIHQELSVPEQFKPEIAIVVGKRADKDRLPENLKEREHPSDRLPLTDLAFKGVFQNGSAS